MPYILIVMFFVTQPGSLPARLDHIESIRFDDQKACKSAASWIIDRINGMSIPGQSSPNNLRIECLPAKSSAP
jgi:hypothetical protein